jgi:transcriptional regulator with XRE-family HTH domain
MTMVGNEEVGRAFGEFVRAQRKLARISQRELAKVTGVSDSYISQLERGQYRPSAAVLNAIAHAFATPPEKLYAQWGLLDEPADTPDVEQAIRNDPSLSAQNKATLLTLYRALQDQGQSGAPGE